MMPYNISETSEARPYGVNGKRDIVHWIRMAWQHPRVTFGRGHTNCLYCARIPRLAMGSINVKSQKWHPHECGWFDKTTTKFFMLVWKAEVAKLRWGGRYVQGVTRNSTWSSTRGLHFWQAHGTRKLIFWREEIDVASS